MHLLIAQGHGASDLLVTDADGKEGGLACKIFFAVALEQSVAVGKPDADVGKLDLEGGLAHGVPFRVPSCLFKRAKST